MNRRDYLTTDEEHRGYDSYGHSAYSEFDGGFDYQQGWHTHRREERAEEDRQRLERIRQEEDEREQLRQQQEEETECRRAIEQEYWEEQASQEGEDEQHTDD